MEGGHLVVPSKQLLIDLCQLSVVLLGLMQRFGWSVIKLSVRDSPFVRLISHEHLISWGLG